MILDSYQRRAESCADGKTSHMFFGRAGGEVDLKQSDGCSKHSDCFKIFFDETKFRSDWEAQQKLTKETKETERYRRDYDRD